MKDNVRTVFMSSPVTEDDDAIQHNIELQQLLAEFLSDNASKIYVGDIRFTRRSLSVTFEALGENDADEILESYGSRSDPAEPGHEDASHGPDGDAPAPTPTSTPTADTDDPDTSDGVTGDDDPGTEPADDPDKPFVLVEEDGTPIASFDEEQEAWDEFENYDTAFDVVER